MNQKMTKVLALAMAASVAMTACGTSAPAEKPAEPSKELWLYEAASSVFGFAVVLTDLSLNALADIVR